jgi:hypothetical protein
MDANPREDLTGIAGVQCLARASAALGRVYRFAAAVEQVHPFVAIAADLAEHPQIHPENSRQVFISQGKNLHPSVQPWVSQHVVALGAERDPERLTNIFRSLSRASASPHSASVRLALLRLALRLPWVASSLGQGANGVSQALHSFLQNHWPADQ